MQAKKLRKFDNAGKDGVKEHYKMIRTAGQEFV